MSANYERVSRLLPLARIDPLWPGPPLEGWQYTHAYVVNAPMTILSRIFWHHPPLRTKSKGLVKYRPQKEIN